MSQVCQICDYSINQSTRKLVNCPYCEFGACRTCCETYVLGETTVKCMNTACNREWTRQYIASVFTATFNNGRLKERREELLFDIERALLPATQPIVERAIKQEQLLKGMNDIKKQIRDLWTERNRLNTEYYNLMHGRTPVERAEFIKSCPDTNCRGFLSTQWKCGLCQKWACPDCHEIKGDTKDAAHTCNPETVATVSMLANDTKPCPNCRTGIFKIDGCDQMWCTQCHTAFNWRTGRIENVVHNPHYFEWLRRNGNNIPRNPGDIPCQNELTHHISSQIRNLLRNKHKQHYLSGPLELFLERTVRNTIHLRHVELPVYRIDNRERRNEALRVQYMRNLISQNQFKTLLQRNEKKTEKYREIYNIMEVLMNTMTEIIFRFVAHINTAEPAQYEINILEEIDPIVDYANDCLRDISKVYKSKQIRFSNEIRMK